MIPFNFHHLYYFYTIAKEKSMSRAALLLKVSQPALSAQIKRFESYFSIKLFRREGRRLVVSEEGKFILDYAETIFNAGRELTDAIQDRSQKGRIRLQIGISDSVPKVSAESFIQKIFKLNPDVFLTVHEYKLNEMVESLNHHALDLLLSDMPARAEGGEGLINKLVDRARIVFCAHPVLARKFKKFPQDLSHYPMILPTADSQIYHALQAYFAAVQVSPKVIAEIHDAELIYRMALSGAAVAPLNERRVAFSKGRSRLEVLGADKNHPILDSLYLIYKKRARPHPIVEKLLSEYP